ncbi:uncharacterized protein [Macrobrachium rosenbergii]|uniref:uncharacterized protein n=1 Tax=Macrobrachium rosenbergii TaxID=79674 RepID=UPI0034D48BCE
MNTLVLLCALVAGATATNFYTGLLGYSGIVRPDGKNVQFTREQADNFVLIGPSGAVTKDGKNMQLVPDTHRTKRSNFYTGLLGYSGIVRPDGKNVQFTREQADNFVLIGPSGAVTKDGKNMQLVPDTHRVKRGAGYVNAKGSIGYSGIVKTDGTIRQFSQDDIDNIVLFGPSGVVNQGWQKLAIGRGPQHPSYKEAPDWGLRNYHQGWHSHPVQGSRN